MKKLINKLYKIIGKYFHIISQRILPDDNYEFSVLPSKPWEFVQRCVEKELYRFLPGIKNQSSVNVVVAGAYTGEEIKAIKHNLSNQIVNAFLFEANPHTFEICKLNFLADEKVICYNKAVSNFIGKSEFHENSIEGTGSLLSLNVEEISNTPINKVESYNVDVTTLDHEFYSFLQNGEEIDLLIIDVQGAEMQLLEGASNTLKKVKSVFIEVQHGQNDYTGGVDFEQIHDFLNRNNFSLFLLGMNPGHNQGNAFYISRSEMQFGKMKE